MRATERTRVKSNRLHISSRRLFIYPAVYQHVCCRGVCKNPWHVSLLHVLAVFFFLPLYPRQTAGCVKSFEGNVQTKVSGRVVCAIQMLETSSASLHQRWRQRQRGNSVPDVVDSGGTG